MFVSGFTIVRNAIKYDYPVVESILSLLPICDEVVVLVGKSEDETLALIEEIGSDKIKIYHSIWDDSLREGGKVLALETDKAKKLVNPKADWCFYIQADEVVNDEYYGQIKDAMKQYKDDPEVEGLLFAYQHFFGNFNYVAKSRGFYRHEIRVVKNQASIQSYKDAQGFRKNGKKLKVKKIEAEIFHYGWVRTPEIMKKKIKDFHQLWHSDSWIAEQEKAINQFDYSEIDSLMLFKGKHPDCMQNRIRVKNWDYKPQFNQKHNSLKDRLLFWFEQTTGYRIGEYKNYKLI
ncbi:MAG: glycosyltransferase family 2 protein [Bacteroidia bacterium]|nr:glycosyltransferase family 2 protein [Bacteroidia bacterium]